MSNLDTSHFSTMCGPYSLIKPQLTGQLRTLQFSVMPKEKYVSLEHVPGEEE